jgi:hypothetical protein
MAGQARADRVALNESRFREINDRVRQDIAQLQYAPAQVAFVCECGRLECRDQIVMGLDEYERVRADAMTFAVVPGHELLDTEDVVARTERFCVVFKHADVAHIVTRTDPRRAEGE